MADENCDREPSSPAGRCFQQKRLSSPKRPEVNRVQGRGFATAEKMRHFAAGDIIQFKAGTVFFAFHTTDATFSSIFRNYTAKSVIRIDWSKDTE